MRKWKIEELVYFSRKPTEITLEELGWFLVSDTFEKRLWWKDGYLIYFVLESEMLDDFKRRILTDYIGFGHIEYVKVGYRKFMVVNLENYSVKIVDHVNVKSTEIIAIPVLKMKNGFVDMAMERIREEEADAFKRK